MPRALKNLPAHSIFAFNALELHLLQRALCFGDEVHVLHLAFLERYRPVGIVASDGCGNGEPSRQFGINDHLAGIADPELREDSSEECLTGVQCQHSCIQHLARPVGQAMLDTILPAPEDSAPLRLCVRNPPASRPDQGIDIGIVERLAVEHVADGGGRRLLEFLVLQLEPHIGRLLDMMNDMMYDMLHENNGDQSD